MVFLHCKKYHLHQKEELMLIKCVKNLFKLCEMDLMLDLFSSVGKISSLHLNKHKQYPLELLHFHVRICFRLVRMNPNKCNTDTHVPKSVHMAGKYVHHSKLYCYFLFQSHLGMQIFCFPCSEYSHHYH